MEFFCYHRDPPGSTSLRDELLDAHGSHMDGCADIEVHAWRFGGRPT